MRVKILMFILCVCMNCKYCYSQVDLYLNRKVLSTTPMMRSEPTIIRLNDGVIDSIVTRRSGELNSESPFTFVYLHSGKLLKNVGECIYYSSEPESLFCLLKEISSPYYSTYEYQWYKYATPQDSIELSSKILVKDLGVYINYIIWYSSVQIKEVLGLQLTALPITNKDYYREGNVIFEEKSKKISIYEFGYLKTEPSWRICAIKDANNTYLVGWYFAH